MAVSEGEGQDQGQFRGWRVVWGSFTVLFVVFGVAYSFPALFDELYREWPGSRRDISIAFGLMSLSYFFVGAVTGPLSDRLDPRWVISIGLVLTGLSGVLVSLATELWHMIVAYGVCLGVGIGFVYVPAVGPIQRWFSHKRGLATGLAVAGIGVGTFAAPIIATELISLWDWRTAFLVIALGGAAIGLVGVTQIISSPAHVGQLPLAAPSAGSGPSSAGIQSEFALKDAIRSRPFIVLYCASFLISFSLFVPFVHLVPSILDLGVYSKEEAVLAASMIGIGSLAGRFVMGPIADLIGRRTALLCQFVGVTMMYAVWLVATEYWTLLAFGLLFGAFYGGYVALLPAVAADYMGARNASGILGLLYTSVGIGTFLGPVLAGEVYDHVKDYTWSLVVFGTLAILAACVLLCLPRTPGDGAAGQN